MNDQVLIFGNFIIYNGKKKRPGNICELVGSFVIKAESEMSVKRLGHTS